MNTTPTTRRTLLKGAAWTAPSVIVATAAPAIAASAEKSILVFTNATATEGKDKNTIYTNTKVMVTEGVAVPGLVVEVQVVGFPDIRQTTTSLAPWGVTDIVREIFKDIPKGKDVTVRFSAWAPGVRRIDSYATVKPPAWWA